MIKQGLLKKREVFAPFEYEQAYEYWLQQQQSHWIHSEIGLSGDIQNWKMNLTEAERHLIGMTLKGFIQAEILVGDYWTQKVYNFFPKPEIAMMAMTFGAWESTHMKSYAYLNESLGLEDYDAFLYEPAVKAKLDRLVDTTGKSKEDIAKSLAVFSAFTEGVSLFSSFAILLSFAPRGLMRGVGKIIEFSVRDESLHSNAGCWLFRTFVSENPDLLTDELKREIYQAGRDTWKLEEAFIDKAFEYGDIEGLTKAQLKNFIRHRINVKLGDIGFKAEYDDINDELLKDMEWFDLMTIGVEHEDFFSNRVSSYAKAIHSADDWDEL